MVADQTERIKKKGGVKAIDLLSEDITGDLAKVTIVMRYGNGTIDTTTMNMLREGNEWKINPQ